MIQRGGRCWGLFHKTMASQPKPNTRKSSKGSCPSSSDPERQPPSRQLQPFTPGPAGDYQDRGKAFGCSQVTPLLCQPLQPQLVLILVCSHREEVPAHQEILHEPVVEATPCTMATVTGHGALSPPKGHGGKSLEGLIEGKGFLCRVFPSPRAPGAAATALW